MVDRPSLARWAGLAWYKQYYTRPRSGTTRHIRTFFLLLLYLASLVFPLLLRPPLGAAVAAPVVAAAFVQAHPLVSLPSFYSACFHFFSTSSPHTLCSSIYGAVEVDLEHVGPILLDLAILERGEPDLRPMTSSCSPPLPKWRRNLREGFREGEGWAAVTTRSGVTGVEGGVAGKDKVALEGEGEDEANGEEGVLIVIGGDRERWAVVRSG